MSLRLLVLLAVFASACGDSVPTMDADSAAPDPTVVPPSPPAAPSWTCPAGWREVTTGCEPYPDGVDPECGGERGHVAYPGGPCVVLGGACPSGDFPDDVSGPAIFVRPGATGGDGSRAAPFGSLAEVDAVPTLDGAQVILSKGRHLGELRLPTGVTLRGACAAETEIVTPSFAETSGALTVDGTDVVIRDLSIVNALRTGLWLSPRSSARVERVAIEGARLFGVLVVGGSLTAEDFLVRNVAQGPMGFGFGMQVQEASDVQLTRAVFDGASGIVVRIGDASTFDASDLVVRGGVPWPDGRLGRGFDCESGARCTVRGLVVEDVAEVAVFASRAETVVSIEDLVVRDFAPEPAAAESAGITAQTGAQVDVRGVSITGRGSGVVVSDMGSRITLADAFIYDVILGESGKGFGAMAQLGGDLVLSRVQTRGTYELAIAVGTDATGTFTDITVDAIHPGSGGFGIGLLAQSGASFEAERVALRDTAAVGLFVDQDAEAVVDDLLVERVASNPTTGAHGRGVSVQDASRATLTRARIEEVHDVGLYIHGGTSFLTAQELTVSGIDAALCIEDGRCPVSTSALGVATASGATVTLDSFEITEADLCGIFVGDGGTMNLSNGVVSRSTIGACVLDASTPLESLSVGVRYVDNDVNLDATTLPEPSVGDFRPSE